MNSVRPKITSCGYAVFPHTRRGSRVPWWVLYHVSLKSSYTCVVHFDVCISTCRYIAEIQMAVWIWRLDQTNWSYFSSNNSMSVPLNESLPPMKSTTELNDLILYSVISAMMSRTLVPLLEYFWTTDIMHLWLIGGGGGIESPVISVFFAVVMWILCRNPAVILCHLLWLPSLFSSLITVRTGMCFAGVSL